MSWVHRDPYSQSRKSTHRTSWVHRYPYSQSRKSTHRTSWVHRDPYSQKGNLHDVRRGCTETYTQKSRKPTHRTSWVHRDAYSKSRKPTHRTSWVHRDAYSQRRELTRRMSWVQVQHEMKQGHYNCCDWRRDRKARTSCFSTGEGIGRPVSHFMVLMQVMGMQGVQLSGVSHTSWVCRECSCLVCPDCKASVNSGTVTLVQQ